MKEGNYDAAIEAFSKVDTYKDSANSISQCWYLKAMQLMEEGKYSDAIIAFSTIPGYEDAEYQTQICYYQIGSELNQAEDYTGAMEAFEKAGDYQDAKVQYVYAQNQNRRMEFSRVGNIVSFGHYYQSKSDEEDISWIVLEVKDHKALLLSRQGLISSHFHKTRERMPGTKPSDLFSTYDIDVEWSSSHVREWLSGTFIKDAFDLDEIKALVPTTIDGSTDKAFILSTGEVKKYLDLDVSLNCSPTSRCKSSSAYDNKPGNMYTIQGNTFWWTRTSSNRKTTAISSNCEYSADIASDTGGIMVRPAIWVDLESDYWINVGIDDVSDDSDSSDENVDDAITEPTESENTIVNSNENSETENQNTVHYDDLSIGSKGDVVQRLQQALIDQGYLSGRADGDFGNKTAGAVKKAQMAFDMEQTGIADDAFQKRLYGE